MTKFVARKEVPAFVGKIVHAVRLNNSTNGNPRFRVMFLDDSGEYREHITKSDASCSYDIENFRRSGKRAHVYLTKAGRVSMLFDAS